MATRTDPLTFFLATTPLDATLQKHLRRVYSTLTYAILLAMAGAILDLYSALPLGRISSFLTLPLLFFFNVSQRYSNTRFYAFYLFALFSGLSSGPLIALAVDADPLVPIVAFAGASLVFMGFSVSALFAKRRSYLFLGGFLWTACWGMAILGIINLFAKRMLGFGVMLYGGLIVLSGFVLYDTQMVVEKVGRGDLDYVSHAMELLIDFVGIFKRLLIIMMRNQQSRKDQDRRKRSS